MLAAGLNNCCTLYIIGCSFLSSGSSSSKHSVSNVHGKLTFSLFLINHYIITVMSYFSSSTGSAEYTLCRSGVEQVAHGVVVIHMVDVVRNIQHKGDVDECEHPFGNRRGGDDDVARRAGGLDGCLIYAQVDSQVGQDADSYSDVS